MNIDDLYSKNKISIRSYNVCKGNEIKNVEELILYYKKRRTFRHFKNCGAKSNIELIDLCNQYDQKELKEFEEVENADTFLNLVLNLNRIQREIINSFILININNLSPRSQNAIKSYLSYNLTIQSFIKKNILRDYFQVERIKKLGKTSFPEARKYFKTIKDFVIEVSNIENDKDLKILKNNFLIQSTFSITKIPEEILESESIFQLTDFLIDQNALFSKNQTLIFKKGFNIYQSLIESTLDEIASEINLTRERARQIRVEIKNSLYDKLSYIKNFNDHIYQKYSIDENQYLIAIDVELTDKINNHNRTDFTKEFITYLLYVYLSENFVLFGNIEDVLKPNYFNANDRHNWNNFYLIKKEINSELDLNSLINDIEMRLNERIEESYSFNFKSYLSRFLTNNNIEILDLALSMSEKIVNDEFELYLDLEENILFERNTYKQKHEFAYEALEQLAKPSKVNEIFKKVIELYPNYNIQEDNIRCSMKRSNGFVPIGRNSVFGLKKWEGELENFKGGTIKDVIIKFLQNKKEPAHILEVLEYLNKYRENKDARSVITNLKVDPLKRFIIFRQNFIGLQSNKNLYNNAKYDSLPVQLGKTIIGLHKKGFSINFIKDLLIKKYELSIKETELILNNLNYFNENKRN